VANRGQSIRGRSHAKAKKKKKKEKSIVRLISQMGSLLNICIIYQNSSSVLPNLKSFKLKYENIIGEMISFYLNAVLGSISTLVRKTGIKRKEFFF
jgi:hypothetical protein